MSSLSIPRTTARTQNIGKKGIIVILTRPGQEQLEIVREYAKTERDTPGTINGIDPGSKSEFKV